MMASKVGFLLAGLAVAAFAVSAKRSPTYERIWRRSTDWIGSTPCNRDSSEAEDVGDMVRRVIFGGLFVLGVILTIGSLIALA
jgi:hypothetical protein